MPNETRSSRATTAVEATSPQARADRSTRVIAQTAKQIAASKRRAAKERAAEAEQQKREERARMRAYTPERRAEIRAKEREHAKAFRAAEKTRVAILNDYDTRITETAAPRVRRVVTDDERTAAIVRQRNAAAHAGPEVPAVKFDGKVPKVARDGTRALTTVERIMLLEQVAATGLRVSAPWTRKMTIRFSPAKAAYIATVPVRRERVKVAASIERTPWQVALVTLAMDIRSARTA